MDHKDDVLRVLNVHNSVTGHSSKTGQAIIYTEQPETEIEEDLRRIFHSNWEFLKKMVCFL